MSKLYRGYDIIISASGRWYINKDGKEVYSMTANEDQVYDWIDREIRKQRNLSQEK